MKKIITFITTFLLIAVVAVAFCSCSKDNKQVYNLSSIGIEYNDNHDELETLAIDEFIEKYPDILNDLGKTLIINNENEITFYGAKTSEFNGEVDIYDAGLMTYVTVGNTDFYKSYENISIFHDHLYTESYHIKVANNYLKFTFQFIKAN